MNGLTSPEANQTRTEKIPQTEVMQQLPAFEQVAKIEVQNTNAAIEELSAMENSFKENGIDLPPEIKTNAFEIESENTSATEDLYRLLEQRQALINEFNSTEQPNVKNQRADKLT